jgi:hypothetical protein
MSYEFSPLKVQKKFFRENSLFPSGGYALYFPNEQTKMEPRRLANVFLKKRTGVPSLPSLARSTFHSKKSGA